MRIKPTSIVLLGLVFVAGFGAGMVLQRYVGAGNVLRSIGYAYPTRTPVPPTPRPTPMLSGDLISEDDRGNLALFILAGQSNMSGVGPVPVDAPGPLARVYLFGNDYRWHIAEEPVDNASGQVDEVSMDSGAGYSPAMAFAAALQAQDPDMRIGLIPCAKGSSSMSQWEPNLSDNNLYGSCIKRARAASTMGELAAILFFQGESEAADPERNPALDPQPHNWAERFGQLVNALRGDLGDEDLPVVFAQIGPYETEAPIAAWEIIQEQQAMVDLPKVAMIKTKDLDLQDALHFSAESYEVIGERFAEAYLELTRQR
jgi:hypothetical protein